MDNEEYIKGYDDGFAAGEREALAHLVEERDAAYARGYDDGRCDGESEGYELGYDDGHADASDPTA